MRRMHLFALALPVLALIGCGDSSSSVASGSGSTPSAGQEVLLRYKPEQGKTYTSTIISDASVAGQQMKMTFVTDQTIEKVEDGVSTVKMTIKDAKSEGIAGDMLGQMKGQTFTMKMDERGSAVQDAASAGNPLAQSGGQTKLPEEAVKVGSTWTDTMDSGGQTMTTTNTVEAFEELDGKPVARVKGELVNADKTMNGTYTSWIELATGIPLKMDMKLSGKTQGQDMTMNMSMTTK